MCALNNIFNINLLENAGEIYFVKLLENYMFKSKLDVMVVMLAIRSVAKRTLKVTSSIFNEKIPS
jgi:hypothetical protein